MLFNSYIFIFGFLPIVLFGFHLIGKQGHHQIAISWLVAASLFFYGWWNPAYLGLIFASIIFNYAIGVSLGDRPKKSILIFGVTVNLSLLVYYKYANFFVDNYNLIANNTMHLENVILPLAISFFTFQQITYIADAYRGKTKEYNFLHYCLFVTFFPQLIAGPIVHHKEMLPQFSNDLLYKLRVSHLSVGITIFMLGLFKKVVFADNIADYSSPIFDAANTGVVLTFFESWAGALAYTFQLYFDFSGYSDMAIGVARMFGVILPINFYSPYKANSIIDFWRRWHISLSCFLRDYLYIPLGGSEKGTVRRSINLMITMLLGGLWHGAGWTFIIWGAMHGVYLTINHGWVALSKRVFSHSVGETIVGKISGRLITFISVVIAWVMFRAQTVDTAISMYSSMFGFNGISLPISFQSKLGEMAGFLSTKGFTYYGMFYNGVFGDVFTGIGLIGFMLLIVWFTPNTLDWLRNEGPVIGLDPFLKEPHKNWEWQPNLVFSLVVAFITVVALMFIQRESEFLYFQF